MLLRSPLRFPLLALVALVFAQLPPVARAAEPYKVGDTLAAFTVKDQHDRVYTFAPGPALLVVSFSMSAGKAANAWFTQQPATFLDDHKALFLSDIHGMPSIGRVFALPKMRKYPHRILLGDDDHLLDRYPRQENKLTVLRLDSTAKITAIDYADPAKDLPAIFGTKS